jgi:peroxiredoxin
MLALFLVAQGKDRQGLGLGQMTNETTLQLILGLAIIGFLAAVVFYLKKILGQQSQIMRRIDALEITLHEGGMLDRGANLTDPREGLPVGAPAPDFALPDANGNTVSLEDLLSRGKPLLFFYVSPTCAPCAGLLPEIEAWAADLKDKVNFVFLSNGEQKENIEKFGAAEILLQEHREVAEKFNSRWTPTAFLVNANGTIASHLAVGDAAIRELAEKIKTENLGRDFFYISNGNKSKIGESVPEFILEDLRGKPVGANDLQGKKTLVTFWSMTCPHCTNMMEELKNWDKQKGADEPNLIVFSDGEAEAHKDLELDSPILLDKNYKTAEKFGMYGTPSAVLVDENGKIVSETAIGADNIWALIGKRK